MISEIQEEFTDSNPIANSQQAIISYISFLKEVKSKKIDEETLKEFSASANEAIKFSDNWFKETTFSKSTEELMEITKKTLDNFKKYFQEKFSSSDSEAILNNLGSSGQFYQKIPNPPNKESLISAMQEYSGYLVKLVALLENTNLEKDESSKKVLDSLAKFPGESDQVDFICLQGTTQRIRDQSMTLDKITYVEQAVKNLLLTKTSQLAPNIYAGNQVHLESCLLYMLHNDQLEISKIDGFYSAPIKNIELKEALTFVGIFSQKFDEEIDQIIDILYENYQKIPLTLSPSDNNAREDFVAKINLAIQSSSAVILTQNDIFEIDKETYEPSLKIKANFKEIILTKIKNSQSKSMDFLREFSTLPNLFCESGDVNFLDITKINSFLKLFELNQGKTNENEKEEIDIAIGIKTLNLLSEKFKGSNFLFLACFFEKFEVHFNQKFEDFFYQPETTEKPREIKTEYEKYKNIIKLTLGLYESNLQKYYGSNVELLNIHKQIYQIGKSDLSDADLKKNKELPTLISSDNFTLKLKLGESNILHYPRQFFEKNTLKFILENVSDVTFLESIKFKLVADTHDPLNNLNPLQIATRNKDQEMLSLFLDLTFNHPKGDQNQALLGADQKFKFIKENKLLSISLKNNDLKTFNFLLEQFDGVDMVAKIKDGIATNDEEILEILDLITKRENIEFFNALKFTHPIDDSISNKLTENAFKNDNSNMLTKLGMVDITPHLARISYKSENIIKKFFDSNFFEKNPIYAKQILSEAFKNNQFDTTKYLIENCNALDSFGNNELKNFLLQSIEKNKIEISKLLIEKFLSPKSSCAYIFGGTNYSLNSIIPHTRGSRIIYQTTYLQFACENNRENIAELLIQKGAKITNDCFKIAIKTKNKDILNLLIKSEMEKSGKTKLEVLKEKSPLIFKKFSKNFDLKILKNLLEDLNDSEKKELLNFKINSGLFCIRSKSTVFDKISKIRSQTIPIPESSEIYSYISDLRNIAYSEIPAQTTRTANADLVIKQLSR